MSDPLDEEIRNLRSCFWSDRDPDGRAFAPLAEAYLQRGDVEEALSLVQEGLSRLPDYATGHLVAARIHRSRGDGEAARQAVEALLSLDPGNAFGLRIRGELAEEAGDLEAAEAAFRQAFQRNPGYADLEGRIARLEQGDPEGGVEPGTLEREEEGEDLQEPAVGEAGPGPEGLAESAEPEEVDSPAETEEVDSPAEPDGFAEPDDSLPGAHLTRTMGDLYARQGLLERAVAVYRHLAERDPGNPELGDRLVELEGRLAGADPGEGEPRGDDPRVRGFEETSPWDEAEAAPQWADREGGGGLDAGSSPFAWAGEDGEEDMVEDPPGPSIGAYFEDLLAWEPGAVPIEALSPGGTGAVPIESLAPRGRPATRSEPRSEGAGGGESEGREGEGADSDFQAWIRSLRS